MTTKLNNVVDGGYCIGCGGCAAASDNIEIIENKFGAYVPLLGQNTDPKLEKICPFTATMNEDDFGGFLFKKAKNYDKRIGQYSALYGGYVKEGSFRDNAGSGGVTTWLLTELLNTGLIDGVIHVGKSSKRGCLFEYQVSYSVEEVSRKAKSRYYPVHYDEILNRIKGDNKRYAFVGVPCFVKSIRLLINEYPEKFSNIKYCLALFCGHMKSKGFSEMIALQQGVVPEELAGIDFRVKNPSLKASQYSVLVHKRTKDKSYTSIGPVRTNLLYGLNWGLGLFKLKGCDWCDDIAGELADITCGDAWLPAYDKDGRGSNIVVIRNEQIDKIIKNAISEGRLALNLETPEAIYASQAGNYRHRQEGLSMRISRENRNNNWYPTKRIQADEYSLTRSRQNIYQVREELLVKSHQYFYDAKKKGNLWLYFVFKLWPVEMKYELANGNFIKKFIKRFLYVLRYYFRS